MDGFHAAVLQNADHLEVGSVIRAYVTRVHNPRSLKFCIRLYNRNEFILSEIIENGQVLLEEYDEIPKSEVFGLGINGKTYRAFIMPPQYTDAYLIDLGIKMRISNANYPIYRLSPLEQSFPALAILCRYSRDVSRTKGPNGLPLIQQGGYYALRIVAKHNFVLEVTLA